MKFIFLLFLFQSSLVFAEKAVPQKDLSLLGKIDGESLKKDEPSKTMIDQQHSMPEKSKFSMTCKDSMGKEFKKGEAGYDTCLSGIKSPHDLNKLNSGLNKKDKNDGNSASFNFKIGD